MSTEDQRLLKDSGQRQQFGTGAVRDVTKGKGRYDLMPAAPIDMLADAVERDSYDLDIPLDVFWDCGRYGLAQTLVTSQMENAVGAMRELAGYIQVKYWNDNKITPTEMQLHSVPYHAIFRIARVYEKGAEKYAPRNWEKGMLLSRFLDSAQRHWYQVLEGKDDEDHAAQALWNIIGWIQTKLWIDSNVLPLNLNDMPKYPEIQDLTGP